MYVCRPSPMQRAIGIVRMGVAGLSCCIVLVGLLRGTAGAQEAGSYFQQNCSMCHTVGGGRLIGPDLAGVTRHKDRAWLVHFLLDPKTMIDSGDAYAGQLLHEANGVVMPAPPGITPALAEALLDYLDSGPAAGQASVSGPVLSDQPFTPADVILGRRLFLGQQRLANDGPACVSCHALRTVHGLGGGRLGPDLTHEIEKLGGRRGAAAWLASPPTTTMKAVFGKHPLAQQEIHPLLAAIEDAGRVTEPGKDSKWKFLGIGFGGMLIGLGLLQVTWRGRMRNVRRSVIRSTSAR